MANLAKLVVSLEAQTAKYERELKKANRQLDRFGRNQRRQLAQVSRAFIAVGVTVGAIFGARAIGALRRFSEEAAKNADALAKQADILGFTTEKLAAYQLAARLSGSDSAGFEKGIKKLQKSIVDATNGLTTYTRAFDALKLDPQQLKQLTPDKQFETLARAFAGLENQVDKVAVAYDLFGGRNTALLNTLNTVGTQIREIEEDTAAWGIALNRVDAKQIENANDQLERARTAMQGFGTQLALAIAPIRGALAQNFAEAAKEQRGFRDQIQETIRSMVVGFNFVANTVRGVRLAFKGVELAMLGLQERAQGLLGDKNSTGLILLDRILGRDPKGTENALDRIRGKIDEVGGEVDELADSIQSGDIILAKYEQLLEQAKKDAQDALSQTVPVEIVLEVKPEEPLKELTIQGPRDAILRPEIEFDIEPLERSGELMDVLTKKTENLTDAQRDLGFTFSSAFEDAIIEGQKLRDVFKGLLQDIIRIALRTTITGPLGDALGGALGGIFGRAAGGPVSAGTTYLVGERGPELFTPTVSGNIVPNGAFGGVSVVNNVNVAAGVDVNTLNKSLPAVLEQNRRATIAELIRLRNEGRV